MSYILLINKMNKENFTILRYVHGRDCSTDNSNSPSFRKTLQYNKLFRSTYNSINPSRLIKLSPIKISISKKYNNSRSHSRKFNSYYDLKKCNITSIAKDYYENNLHLTGEKFQKMNLTKGLLKDKVVTYCKYSKTLINKNDTKYYNEPLIDWKKKIIQLKSEDEESYNFIGKSRANMQEINKAISTKTEPCKKYREFIKGVKKVRRLVILQKNVMKND